MKKDFILLLLSVICVLSLNSCGENDYEFIGSRQGELHIYDRTFALDDKPKFINIAVDIYRKKIKQGYKYMVKSQEGNEYELFEGGMVSKDDILLTHYAANYRHHNYLGVLYVKP